MGLIRYQIVRQEFDSPELGRYTSYGIAAVTMPAQIQLAFVADVSTSKDFVAELADRCTKGQLDPTQLMDVILDSL
mgnify:CR=1 FL=1